VPFLCVVSEATASLDALQSRAEMHTMGELTRQLDYILASAVTSVNWAPEGPPAQMGCESRLRCLECEEEAVPRGSADICVGIDLDAHLVQGVQ
jgi:hypothetical protein